MVDTKITGLTANTTPLSTDVTVVVDDPGGTALSQKITLANLMALFANPVTDDGDGLGTAALRWADLFLASGGVINFNAGNVTLTHAAGSITIAGGTLLPAAVTTTVAGFKLQSGTLLTTPEVGAVELNGTNIYGTTDAGNRGYIPVRHYIRADATRTFTSNTSEQAIFNSPANGRLTLETGTYLFEGQIMVTAMSGTSGNASFDILGAGTATCAAWLWNGWGADATGITAVQAVATSYSTTQQSAVSIVTGGAGTAMAINVQGTVEVTGAGTMIPSLTMVTAAASIVSIGSYMTFERVGSTTAVSLGQWD